MKNQSFFYNPDVTTFQHYCLTRRQRMYKIAFSVYEVVSSISLENLLFLYVENTLLIFITTVLCIKRYLNLLLFINQLASKFSSPHTFVDTM